MEPPYLTGWTSTNRPWPRLPRSPALDTVRRRPTNLHHSAQRCRAANIRRRYGPSQWEQWAFQAAMEIGGTICKAEAYGNIPTNFWFYLRYLYLFQVPENGHRNIAEMNGDHLSVINVMIYLLNMGFFCWVTAFQWWNNCEIIVLSNGDLMGYNWDSPSNTVRV